MFENILSASKTHWSENGRSSPILDIKLNCWAPFGCPMNIVSTWRIRSVLLTTTWQRLYTAVEWHVTKILSYLAIHRPLILIACTVNSNCTAITSIGNFGHLFWKLSHSAIVGHFKKNTVYTSNQNCLWMLTLWTPDPDFLFEIPKNSDVSIRLNELIFS